MLDSDTSLAIAFDHPSLRDQAEHLRARLGYPLAKKFRDPHQLHLTLMRGDDDRVGLELRVVEQGHPLSGGRGVSVDWSKLDVQSGPGRSLQTPLHKAVGLRKRDPHRPRVLDATAGLGEDTWLLASAGCLITALERQPVIHALLEDGLQAAAATAPDTAQRITLRHADAIDVLSDLAKPGVSDEKNLHGDYDVVLIDPMFPVARKAMQRKPMRVLRMLVGHDPDAADLLQASLAVAKQRVVVKRPRHAPPLTGPKPAATHAGRGLRLDVYPTR